jgi:hypothetical protein
MPVNVHGTDWPMMKSKQPRFHQEDSMPASIRSTRITVDLLEYKQQWIDYCHANNTTPSEGFRQVIAKLTAAGITEAPMPMADAGHDKIRKEVRLTPSEVAAAESLAAHEGFTLTRWITALVQTRLTGGAQLGQQELELLARSNLHLLAISSGLRQMVKVLHLVPNVDSEAVVRKIDSLHQTIRQHTIDVSDLIAANARRWRA